MESCLSARRRPSVSTAPSGHVPCLLRDAINSFLHSLFQRMDSCCTPFCVGHYVGRPLISWILQKLHLLGRTDMIVDIGRYWVLEVLAVVASGKFVCVLRGTWQSLRCHTGQFNPKMDASEISLAHKPKDRKLEESLSVASVNYPSLGPTNIYRLSPC